MCKRPSFVNVITLLLSICLVVIFAILSSSIAGTMIPLNNAYIKTVTNEMFLIVSNKINKHLQTSMYSGEIVKSFVLRNGGNTNYSIVSDDQDTVYIENYINYAVDIMKSNRILLAIRYCESSLNCILVSSDNGDTFTYKTFPSKNRGIVVGCEIYKDEFNNYLYNSSTCYDTTGGRGRYNILGKEYYTEPLERKAPYYYTYYSKIGEKMICFCNPVYFDDGVHKGVINVCYSNEDTDIFIRNISKNVNGVDDITIFNTSGYVISKSYNLTNSSYNDKEVIDVNKKKDVYSKAYKVFNSRDYNKVITIGSNYYKYEKIKNTEYIVAVGMNTWNIQKYGVTNIIVLSSLLIIALILGLSLYIFFKCIISEFIKKLTFEFKAAGEISKVEIKKSILYKLINYIKFKEFDDIDKEFDPLAKKVDHISKYIDRDEHDQFCNESSNNSEKNSSINECDYSEKSNESLERNNIRVCVIIAIKVKEMTTLRPLFTYLSNKCKLYVKLSRQEFIDNKVIYIKINASINNVYTKKFGLASYTSKACDLCLKIVEDFKDEVKIYISNHSLNINNDFGNETKKYNVTYPEKDCDMIKNIISNDSLEYGNIKISRECSDMVFKDFSIGLGSNKKNLILKTKFEKGNKEWLYEVKDQEIIKEGIDEYKKAIDHLYN